TPEFYKSARDNEGFHPDAVIFDWEYSGEITDSSTQLADILLGSHVLVAIYSGTEHKPQIEDALMNPRVKPFIDRVFTIWKAEGAASELREKINNHYEINFSGKYSRDIRRAAQKSC
ncbi:MAG: hypothetical protein HC888_16530, partial [Candidatus Competibacteraceae bacterium]|nr:hypothetical protein [Candidatus Competibacteraceae bacterium]